MSLVQCAEPAEVLGLAQLRDLANFTLLAHSQNRGALLPQRCLRLAGKIRSADGRWSVVEWSGSKPGKW
jgi:hypothetical protein